MDLWEDAVGEALDAEGVEASLEQISAVAGWMRIAASYIGESYPPPAEPRREPPQAAVPERKMAWWEDTSQLSGGDWVLARQIHQLINSR